MEITSSDLEARRGGGGEGGKAKFDQNHPPSPPSPPHKAQTEESEDGRKQMIGLAGLLDTLNYEVRLATSHAGKKGGENFFNFIFWFFRENPFSVDYSLQFGGVSYCL